MGLDPAMATLAKARTARFGVEWDVLSWTERLEVCIEVGGLVAAGSSDEGAGTGGAAASGDGGRVVAGAGTETEGSNATRPGLRTSGLPSGSARSKREIVPKTVPAPAGGEASGRQGRGAMGMGGGASKETRDGGGAVGSFSLGARLVPSVIVADATLSALCTVG